MTDKQLNKAWTAVSVFLLAFCLDSWLRTQGAEPIFGSRLPDDERSASALFGFILTALAMLIQMHLARVYSGRRSGSLASKLPIAFFEELDFDKDEATRYQKFMYAVMHILPLLSLIHFYRIVIDSKYYIQSDCSQGIRDSCFSVWAWPDPYIWNNGYRLSSCDGVTFFPTIEPALLAVLGFYVLLLNTLYFLRLRIG